MATVPTLLRWMSGIVWAAAKCLASGEEVLHKADTPFFAVACGPMCAWSMGDDK